MKPRSVLAAIGVVLAWALTTVVPAHGAAPLASDIEKGEDRQMGQDVEISEDPTSAFIIRYQSDFSVDEDGWAGGFADYPISILPEDLEMKSAYEGLPVSLGLDANGLMLQGDNHSDDLFMYAARPYDGLWPNTTYRVLFNVVLASNAATGTVGVGGSPGDSVYVKAGVSLLEPNAVIGDNDHWRMNIDKGNQAGSGEDAVTIGTIGVELPGIGGGPLYRMKALYNSQDPVFATTDDQGHVWLFVGIDSGFAALTRIYFTDMEVEFAPIPRYKGKINKDK